MAFSRLCWVSPLSIPLCPNVAIELADEKSRATMRFRGKVTMDVMQNFYLRAPEVITDWMEGLGLESYDCLVDMREANLGFKMSDIKRGREAVVASTDLIYGLARLYQILQPRRSIYIFRDIAKAEVFLDG